MVYKTYFLKQYMPETSNATLTTCFTMERQHKYQEDLYFTEVFGFCTTARKDKFQLCIHHGALDHKNAQRGTAG